MATARDPYQVLGLGRTASAEDVKQAYRRLAKQYHPDLNPGRSDIEQRFKEVSAAYNLLSDPDRRARFDRGEIDAAGNERAAGGFHRAHARNGRAGGADFSGFDADDLFSDLFGSRKRGGGFRSRGSDIAYSVTVPFVEAALGTKRRINLSTGKSLEVAIPPGTEDQQKLRLKGQGTEGMGGGTPGDAIVEIHVEPHAFFVRKDSDIHLELPISLPEAVLGATVKVPTLDGQVAVKVPRGSNTGYTLRLKGKGIQDPKRRTQGDQYVKLKVVLPDPPDAELASFLEKWAENRDYDVRKKAGLA
ncbi:MAG TPA: J domain-containing protein [Arenibaculum sp.]|nr:J domain-containing protein [Arenibaculum sp.]